MRKGPANRSIRLPRAAMGHVPVGTTIVATERMSSAFTKYHLDDGRALHHFRREEPHAAPHDHPWPFETTILAGGYVEEVFQISGDGSWSSTLIERRTGETYRIEATHIHRIVGLPSGNCWTIVRAGAHERTVRFWRFGDGVRSRAWNQRGWMSHG